MVQPAIDNAFRESADCLRLDPNSPSPPHDTLSVADAAVRLSRSLARQGWRIHQHAGPTFRHEPQSTPVPLKDIPQDVQDLATEIGKRINAAFGGTPPPHLRAISPDVPTDQDGGILLPLPTEIPLDKLERTVNRSTDRTQALATWSQLIPELAEGWAILPSTAPLSWGRIFLAHNNRIIFWPKAVNDLLAYIPISYDHAADLVRILATMGFKIDLKAAFRSLRIAAFHSRYYGAVLDDVFLQFTRAPFGSTCSPAHFTLLLRQTIMRVRGEAPAFDRALAAFVDDLAGAAGDGFQQRLPESSRNLMDLADRLVAALISDGWWISIPKTFLHPAFRLYYTGLIAHIVDGEIGVAPEKAAKLRMLISLLTPPTPGAFARTTQQHRNSASLPQTVVTQLRSACAAEPDIPIAVAALPLTSSEWPSAPLHSFHLHTDASLPGKTDSTQLGDAPPSTIALHINELQTHLRSLPPIAKQPPTSTPPFILVSVSSYALAETIATETPPSVARTIGVPIVIAYPRSHEPNDSTAPWFSPTMRLPWPTPRPLPAHDSLPPALPPTDPPTPTSITYRTDLNTDLLPHEFAALQTILGYTAWIAGSVVPSISAWLHALYHTRQHAHWTPTACTAIQFLWDIAPYLPGWRKQHRHVPTRTLHIAVDTARGSWAAALPPTRMAVGTIPFHARAASTLAREAWGAVSAIQSHIRRHHTTLPFDAVAIEVDNQGLAESAGTASIPTPDAAPPMRMLAALDYQGVPTTLRWRSRDTPIMKVVDSATTAAILRVSPLRRHIATYIYASLPNGWQVDAPSDDHRSWSDTYLTAGEPERQRATLFAAAAACAARETTGWIGDLPAWRTTHAGRTLFAHGLRSHLHAIAHLASIGTPMVVVAPLEGEGQWWSPALEYIRHHASTVRALPRASTDHPNAPSPRDPEAAHYANPPPPVADVRRLAAYYINVPCTPVPYIADRPGRPLWWTPYRLTADGDVEEHPGMWRHTSIAHDDITAFARQPTTAHRARRSDATPGIPHPQRANTHTASETHAPPAQGPSSAQAPHSTSRTTHRPDQLAGFARPTQPTIGDQTSTIQPTSPPAAAPPPRKRSRGEPETRPDAAPTAVPRRIVAHQAATPLIPLTTATTTVGAWLSTLRNFLKGTSAGTIEDTVPLALRGFIATARSTTRLKTVLGSSRADKAIRYLTHLASALPDVANAPFNTPTLDALACAYAIRRLDPHPPFGWKRCTTADTPASDLSSIAELSRKAGIRVEPHLGSLASSYLASRGAGTTADHSDAWPIHLTDLATCEPKPRSKSNHKWLVWAACLVCSALCLRPGVLPHLTIRMFIQWDRGYILVWRWQFKAASGDVLDPEMKSPTIRIAAARFPLLTSTFTELTPTDTATPLFTQAAVRDMSSFIQNTFPSAPKGFSFRVYGLRIAADVAACALDIPDDITNAMFWWRTVLKSMRAYYGALMIRRMYLFSEARLRLKCIHITPGRFDARLTSGRVPDLSANAMLRVTGPPMPTPDPAQLDAAWGAEAGVAAKRQLQIQRIALGDAAWGPLPVAAPPSSDDDDAQSLDCQACTTHLDRRTRGTLCEEDGCNSVRCTNCHTFKRTWYCPAHAPSAPTKHRRTKR